jgi:hypothetical protein
MDIGKEADRPVLVDFVGGKRYRGNTNIVDEETAVDALILAPDGRLIVRNSRADTDVTQVVDPRDGEITTRQDRVESARRRVNEVLRRGVPGEPANKEGPRISGKKG